MIADSVLDQEKLNLAEPKKFSSKIFFIAVFSAFLFGVILTLKYRPDFVDPAYEMSVSDYEKAQSMCTENNKLKSISISLQRKYHITALCENGDEITW